MPHSKAFLSSAKLKLLPAYAGVDSIDEVLYAPRAARLLWLEILVNDQLDLTPWQDDPVLQEAYSKACRWYTSYRSVITAILSRSPLPYDSGPIDFREFRTFAEALRFATDHHFTLLQGIFRKRHNKPFRLHQRMPRCFYSRKPWMSLLRD